MSKIVLGLVGPMASGKGAMKKYIEEKYGGRDCRFSTVLREVLDRVGEPINRENMQKISTVLRQTFGEDLLAKVIVKDAGMIDSNIVIVDGVRREADIKYLKELENFYLIAINASPEVRYNRMIERNENVGDKDKTLEQFMTDQQAEADREIPQVMKKADFTIDNSGGWDNFYAQIDVIIKKLTDK